MIRPKNATRSGRSPTAGRGGGGATGAAAVRNGITFTRMCGHAERNWRATTCDLAATASAAAAAQSGTTAVTQSGPLIIEPGARFSPVYKLINGARRSVDVTMYELDDTTVEAALVAMLGKTWAEVTEDDYLGLLRRLDLKPHVIEFQVA